MKNIILAFAITATVTSFPASIYLACLENPTDIQKQLSTTTNAIAVAGTTAIFGLLDDEEDDKSEDDKREGRESSEC